MTMSAAKGNTPTRLLTPSPDLRPATAGMWPTPSRLSPVSPGHTFTLLHTSPASPARLRQRILEARAPVLRRHVSEPLPLLGKVQGEKSQRPVPPIAEALDDRPFSAAVLRYSTSKRAQKTEIACMRACARVHANVPECVCSRLKRTLESDQACTPQPPLTVTSLSMRTFDPLSRNAGLARPCWRSLLMMRQSKATSHKPAVL